VGDKELLELAAVMRAAGIHPAQVVHVANGGSVMLAPRDIAAIARAAAAIATQEPK
jgi:hypothetical protein